MPEARRERKVVTVLFVDLVGFTARAEQLDPEDVEAELSLYFPQVRGELERYGGTLEKFIGDAVVAVFGAPVAHEDDPERAVRAALAVRDWARQEEGLEVRIGVNTGEALVRLGARPEAGEGMATGDVVNTAARLQAAAPVNGILVGGATHRATRHAIAYQETAPVEAKGKARPVIAYEALELRSRFGVDVEQAPRTELVGRERELGMLREAFQRAREEREPQLVTLVGVPGIGKTRIVYELSRIVDADSALVSWRQGRCLPYGKGVSFWALGEMVKAQAGILESDGPQAAAEKLAGAVAAAVPAADADWVRRRLGPLVGLTGEETSHGAREEGFPAWRRFIEGVAERGPTVLVFEDLHWADDGLLDFLDELAEMTTGVPLLVVCTARPELLAKRPHWGGGRTNALTLSLPPLSADETSLLVHRLFQLSVLPAELQRALLERAGGNPLYAEEFARMLAESGGAELAVPDTVQGIIAARLDALAPEHKRLLQDAAVVGKVFWAGAVAAMDGSGPDEVESALRELERRELVRRERRSSVAGEIEYAFRHVLIRDVAYGQIPRSERGDMHRSAAGWIRSLGRPDDHAELLAHHYLEALDYARVAGRDMAALADPARAALRVAGDRTYALGSYESAVRYYSAALDISAGDGAERAELLYRYGSARFWADGTGEDVIAESVSRLREAGRLEAAARAALLASRAAWGRGDRESVDRWLADVDTLLAGYPNSIVRTEALVVRSGFHMVAEEPLDAIGMAREAISRIEGIDRPDLMARCLDVIGSSRVSLGDEGGLADEVKAIEIGRKARALWELHHAYNNLCVSHMRLGRLHDFDRWLKEWRVANDEVGGTHYGRSWLIDAEATSDYLAGHWDRAVEEIDRFLGGLPEGATHYLEPDLRTVRALIHHARGLDPRADVERAVSVSRRSGGDAQTIAPCLCARAALLLADGQTSAAVLDLEDLIALRGQLAMGLNTTAQFPAFAWLAVDLGRGADAAAALDGAPLTRWTDVGRAILRGDKVAAADLLAEIGHRPAAAYACLRAGGSNVHRALDFYRSVGATFYIREAEALLAASG
ncbi:MAG TPA: AAA family ATPase [Candidatus Dormibacteraeota bacterium]|nr:AAA family ATPase [Candidatus Dormibacteraeota bacterium]